jgi:hypothetical protein
LTGKPLQRAILAALLVVIGMPGVSSAQYFGRNKVQYRAFDFHVLQTDHFDLYYYPEEEEAAHLASRLAERWYARLSRFFEHQLRGRQVLILYASPSHFRQTNAIEGLIGEGTGGVTEALKRRVVLPMAGSLADTDHVIGHELVHAFQFDMTGADPRDGDTGGGPGILQYPLWFVEGMAEYLSLGPVDAQTAMWMRDAALHEKLPRISDLEKPEYFPYRWGHAFWAFVGAKYGDRAVASLVRSAANPRFDLVGLARQLGTEPDQLNADWHHAIRVAAEAGLANQPSLASDVRRIISRTTGGGRYNVGPRVSPDGRYVAFFSERDRFSIDLYLADAQTGRIERKLIGSATDPHFDSLQFLNSAGAWSPDGRTLAITAGRGGGSVLALIDPRNGRNQREVELPGLADAINPVFSPDGRSVALSGNRGGFVDLFLVSLENGMVEQLTNDAFADLEPTFTPDGASIVFVTERFTTDLTALAPGALRLARLAVATRTVEPMAGFLRGKQLSPQISPDGRTVTFIGEPDGVSNLYRMAIDGGPILQISALATGVAGITTSSPALSMSADGRMAFSVFEDNGEAIYLLDPEQIVTTVAPETQTATAAALATQSPPGEVQRMLTDASRGLPPTGPTPPALPYTRKLTLDFLAQPTVTVGLSQFGGFIGGGMAAFFSDMLGDRALGVSGRIAGGFSDFGGSLAYINRRHRWNWAAVLEQTPFRVDYLTASEDPATDRVTLTDRVDRQIVRGFGGVAAFPFSQASRVELSAGAHALTFQRELRTADYTRSGLRFVGQDVERLPSFDTLYLAEATAALVYDTSFFGATSPIYGRRHRLQVGQSAGSLSYTTVLADWRQYFMPKRPVTFAFRTLHYGRYGTDSEAPQLISLYAGYPELVHGYALGSFSPEDCEFVVGAFQCNVAQNLVGSRMVVANAEVRAPLLGLFRGDVQYGPVPIEIAAFADAGMTWTKSTRPTLLGGTRDVLRSVGGAARFNAFGLLIVEVAASRPLDRPNSRWRWQVGIREGF